MGKSELQAVILAAGSSSRFHTSKTKLSYTLCGQELILYPIKLLKELNVDTTLVLGHQKEILSSIINDTIINDSAHTVNYAYQEKQLGTGHALLCTEKYWDAENILIINGDMPLVNTQTITDLISAHKENKSAISFVTAYNNNPDNNYGRVVKKNGYLQIIEAKEFKELNQSTQDQLNQNLINAGIYIVNKEFLRNSLKTLEKSSLTHEFYITDLVEKAHINNLPVSTTRADLSIIQGVNTLNELQQAEYYKQSEIIFTLMSKGVYIKDPQNTYIDISVTIEPNVVIEPNVYLKKNTYIARNTIVKSGSVIENSYIKENVTIEHNSIIKDSTIDASSTIGPFAHIKLSSVSQRSTIGNFVEVSKSTIDTDTKAKHLSYIGQSYLGSHVNIGAGTITCNYNGVSKHKTIIDNNAFIGSNSVLVAPVTVHKNSITGAGSVITEDIPENSLAIARTRQINKENYAEKLKNRYKKQKQQKEQETI